MKAPNQAQFHTILVIEEFGSPNSPALQYAQSIARVYRSTLVLMHSIDPVSYAFSQNAPEDPIAREELAYFEQEMSSQHLPLHTALETEVVYQRILQAVRDYQADLIILGTHGARSLGRLALGAVAGKLLGNAPCPVLCVPPADDTAVCVCGEAEVGVPVATGHA